MNVARPYSAVVPTLEGDALVVLARSSGSMTGRQVAGLVQSGSQPAINQALNRLLAQGVVLRESAGRAYLYRLNREHLAFPAVEALASMRGLLLERLRSALAAWTAAGPAAAPVHCSLFGSAARGDGDSTSDIDLFLVRPEGTPAEDPDWLGHVDALRTAVSSWTGNRAGIVDVAQEDCATLRADNPRVVEGIERDGIALSGPALGELLAGRS